MKITHICLTSPFSEGWGYQENILAEIHSEEGNKVSILTTEFFFNEKHQQIKRKRKDYINQDGLHITALPYRRIFNQYAEKFGLFTGIYEKLDEIRPDVIFVHGGQFVSLKDVIRYCRDQKITKLYIDQHGDYYNMPMPTWLAKMKQKHLFGYWMRKAIPYCSKYWGVTPWRCQYLKDVYSIPEDRIGLLVMGADDRRIPFANQPEIRKNIRETLGLKMDDFVVITGGKMDKTKNIHLLMQAICELNKDNLKLIVFGRPNDEMQPVIAQFSENPHIRNIGWLDSAQVYQYYLACDLAVFPGTHSVLWEQACGCGLPILVKDWEGMHHVDVGGNCRFLKEDSAEEIKEKIMDICSHHDQYQKMKTAAVNKGIPVFSYREIAKRAIS